MKASERFIRFIDRSLSGDRTQCVMPDSTDKSESPVGDVPLGTLGTYEDAFLALISEAVTSGRAVRADRLTVDGDLFDSDQAILNQRRLIEAFIRKHFDRGVQLGLFGGECEIIWDEEVGTPQVLARPPHPEDNYSASELARELIGASCCDAWTQDPAILTIWAFARHLADDGASLNEVRSAEHLTFTVGGLLQEVQNLLLCIALASGTDPVDIFQRFVLLDRDMLVSLFARDPDREDVETARAHVVERLYGRVT